MDLLTSLDKIYSNVKSVGQTYDRNYYHYQDIKIYNSYSNNSFLCLKQAKTKFIIVDDIDYVKLHLTDSDIVHILCELDPYYFNLLIKSFYKYYYNVTQEFKFEIQGIEFKTPGLIFSEDERKKFNILIETKADFYINFDDLVNLINLILAKELSAMNLSKEVPFNRIKRLLAKYISLSRYYREKDGTSANYLAKIGYDITLENVYSVYSNDWKQRKIDNLFNNTDIFENYYKNVKITVGES